MAKIGYSFGSGGKSRKRQNGGMRRIIIFIVLAAVAGGVVYFFRPSSKEASENQEFEQAAGVEQSTSQPVADSKDTPETAKAEPEKPAPKAEKEQKSAAPVPAVQVNVPEEIRDMFTKADQAFKRNDYVNARKLCENILNSGKLNTAAPLWEQTAQILSKSNIKILHSDIPFPEKKITYRVKPGDALSKIAKKYNTTVETLQKSNNMEPTNYNIWLGQTMKIYKGDWRIVVSKSKRILFLYDGNKLFKIYHIGIGKQNRTPLGNFDIVSKIKRPSWYSPSGKVYPYGSKENVLGTRWLALKPTGETDKSLRGYGIHGTWDPDSIGKAESNGCIRMKNGEVEELFSIVPYNTPVQIIK
ncbi:L,D-transpeptidase family protein [Lentisphaerota bacterium ZTH]|nr:L,D-transpeptidase family protein [Lentisphaerota bacterium]WET06922.1 L,D-transpeptidase family protein [Lentisphaerota bacterium ZTH]